jgi:hypothetical protein
MMEAVSTYETSVNFYQTAQRNIPEDSHLHTRRRENLKSHLVIWEVSRSAYNQLFKVKHTDLTKISHFQFLIYHFQGQYFFHFVSCVIQDNFPIKEAII